VTAGWRSGRCATRSSTRRATAITPNCSWSAGEPSRSSRPSGSSSIAAEGPDSPDAAAQVVLDAFTHARDEAGHETFDREVTRGTALSYDEAVGYLRSTLDALLADTSS
jgi:hypothetical protein